MKTQFPVVIDVELLEKLNKKIEQYKSTNISRSQYICCLIQKDLELYKTSIKGE